MGKRLALLACAGLCLATLAAAGGRGDGRGDGPRDNDDGIVYGGVQRFATLPARSLNGLALGHPEGLCADAEGNIYANSFEQPAASGYIQNYIYKFNRQGRLVTSTPTPQGVVPLGCTVTNNKFYMNDVFGGDELEYELPLTASSVPSIYHICGGFIGNPGPVCGLNANYAGPDGRIYMSDNGAGLFGDFIGRIWVLNPRDGSAEIFIAPPELMVQNLPVTQYVPTGTVLPYSANGVAFSRDGSALYIANMSTNTIYKQRVKHCRNRFTGCQADGDISVFSHDPRHFIQGPDNIDFDDNGYLWIASGQTQHVVALDQQGNVAGVFGTFRGFDNQGAPIGLLQPSGVIFSKGKLYIGNESSQSLLPAADNIDWGAQKLFTVSSIDLDAIEGGHPHDNGHNDHSHDDWHW
jgi:sugar lactone lactonase YvrE